MPDRDDKNWAGKGFSRRNEESAPEPKQPKLRVVSSPKRVKPKYEDDEEGWVWE